MKVCRKCNVLGDLEAADKLISWIVCQNHESMWKMQCSGWPCCLWKGSQWIVNWHDEPSNELYNDPLFAKVKNIYDEKRLSKCWNDNFIALENWIKNKQVSAQPSNNIAWSNAGLILMLLLTYTKKNKTYTGYISISSKGSHLGRWLHHQRSILKEDNDINRSRVAKLDSWPSKGLRLTKHNKCWNDNFIVLEDWIKNEQVSAQLSNNTAWSNVCLILTLLLTYMKKNKTYMGYIIFSDLGSNVGWRLHHQRSILKEDNDINRSRAARLDSLPGKGWRLTPQDQKRKLWWSMSVWLGMDVCRLLFNGQLETYQLLLSETSCIHSVFDRPLSKHGAPQDVKMTWWTRTGRTGGLLPQATVGRFFLMPASSQPASNKNKKRISSITRT